MFATAWTVSLASMFRQHLMLHHTKVLSNGVFNSEPECKKGITSCFQKNLGYVYSVMIVVSAFVSIVLNACWIQHRDTVHHLEWWNEMPLGTCLGQFLFTLTVLCTVVVIFLQCQGQWLYPLFEHCETPLFSSIMFARFHTHEYVSCKIWDKKRNSIACWFPPKIYWHQFKSVCN